MDKKLYRDEYRKKIAGVCAGLADYFNIDVAIVRVVFLLALIFHGGGGLIYIIFWIVLPKKPYVSIREWITGCLRKIRASTSVRRRFVCRKPLQAATLLETIRSQISLPASYPNRIIHRW